MVNNNIHIFMDGNMQAQQMHTMVITSLFCQNRSLHVIWTQVTQWLYHHYVDYHYIVC